MELPREISNKVLTVTVVVLLVLLLLVYRAYVNSRQALQILEIQVPNITRVAFDTEVFSPTPGNLDAILKKVTGLSGATEIEKFKKEFDSNLWIGVMIRNRGLKSATDIEARIRLTTPITAIRGFNSTIYARLETKGEGVGKEEVVLNWTHLEPRTTSVIFLGVQPKEFDAKPPYSKKDMQLWARDFPIHFEMVEARSKEGAIAYAY